MYANFCYRRNTASIWFDRSQIVCPVNFSSEYFIRMNLKNPAYSHRSLPFDFVGRFFLAARCFNSYFRSSNAQTKNRKHIKSCVFNSDGTIDILLETEFPIPNPKRAGNCMRQFTVFMRNVGGWSYLSPTTPGKLLRSK